MIIRLMVRVFVDGKLQWENPLTLAPHEIEAKIAELAAAHATLAAMAPTMIELEFLDEPNFQQRFFRIGTDPRHMVAPIAIDLEDLRKP